MPTVNIRELGRNPSKVVDEVTSTGRPALVTKNGRPVAAVVPISDEALMEWILATTGDPPLGESFEASPEQVLAEARPIHDYGKRVIPGLTAHEAAAFWDVINDL